MLDELVAIIETLQHRIATHRADLQANETRTRMALIDPLLTALGWDTSDPALVTPEYRVDAGWADYALRSGGENPAAVVEAKRLGSFVENHLDQAVGYCITQGIPYAAVTDGNNWQLYRTFEPVPLAEKRVLDVSVNGAAAHECALQFLLLWRSNLSTGHPVEPNRPVVGTSSSSPPQPPSKPPPSTEDGWVGLSEFTPVSGTKPPSNMGFPDGSKSPITLWRQLEQHTVVWLWQNKLLNSANVPVAASNQRYIVNTEPRHQKGNSFTTTISVPGTPLSLEGNVNAMTSTTNAKKLLQHCGVDPATVYVQVSQ